MIIGRHFKAEGLAASGTIARFLLLVGVSGLEPFSP